MGEVREGVGALDEEEAIEEGGVGYAVDEQSQKGLEERD
jgi:hypothetical protein